MESSASLWSTLHSITSIKRQELAKQRDACKALQTELLETVDQESDPRSRVRLFLKDAGKRVPADKETLVWRRKPKAHEMTHKKESTQHEEILGLAGLSAPNIQRFIEQSEKDASVSPVYFRNVENKFRSGLRAQAIKYEYATLFSDLVTERSSEQPNSVDDQSFEAVGRREMQEQRKEWESLVFQPLKLDQKHILNALEKTFGSPEAVQSLDKLRKSMDALCHELLEPSSVNVYQMKQIVNGMISSDLLADCQTAILKQARTSPTWLSEMADVLNLRLASIERWNWETEAMPLEMRRQLNGKYRVFMHEDITQALLIYHIGITFATRFARMLDDFYRSPGWKKHTGVGRDDQAKFDYFISHGRAQPSGSIRNEMRSKFETSYFISVLPRSISEGAGGYGEDALGDPDVKSRVQHSVETKQQLLHLLVTESLLADRLNEEMIALQTDFRWFGPSLSHSTIAAVMRFFGVTETWRSFFDKFLRAPMRFVQDGPEGAIRTRERGVPMSHVLSDFFGESALFCVDFTVNEATLGKPMYRLHDDIWLWGSATETVAAWESLTSLTKVMGIELNTDKTGAARLTRNDSRARQPLPNSLPAGPLRWGLLSVQRGGQFEIDQVKIDEHILELRRQLGSRKSILAWIKAYNTYMQFFGLHFCRPANALGRSHVDNCLNTLDRVHENLFAASNGNVATYVKEMISARFGVKDIPDGFVFFPLGVGGLELRNPFVPLQSMREKVLEEPMDVLDEALEREEVQYRSLKERFDKNGPADIHALSKKPKEFMSREEFAVFRREHSPHFLGAWNELLTPGTEEPVQETAETATLLQKMPADQRAMSPLGAGDSEPYWQSLMELYGTEMGEMFGGLHVVEKGLLPMGMVELFKGKVRWEA
jgi:hypothetical protein